LRLKPPDILLTNYKMLDYLLLRPRDYALWKDNKPETLRYIVVDELHTFDGAQGTDLACLLRRLKERLKTPKESLCCIGTSATLGGNDNTEDLRLYAQEVFSEPFDEKSIVTESLITPDEFFSQAPVSSSLLPSKQNESLLSFETTHNESDFVSAQAKLWFGAVESKKGEADLPLELAEMLKGHSAFRLLMSTLGNQPTSYNKLIEAFDKSVPDYSNRTDSVKRMILDSLVALVAAARTVNGNQRLPFLHVRHQLWQRELRRTVAEVCERPQIRYSDDLTEEQLKNHLAMIHCRECGAMGWGATKRIYDNALNPDLQHFYECFFAYNPTTTFIFPEDIRTPQSEETGSIAKLCGHCLHLNDADATASCLVCGKSDRLLRVFVPNTRIRIREKMEGSHNCPFCSGYESLTILGSRAASLISIAISQLYASRYNDDKKLLAFSDSVQDASHRAGFFAARTYRFNFRSALQQFVNAQSEEYPLSDLSKGFVEYWWQKKGDNDFISTFMPPDMNWFEDYEYLTKNGHLPTHSDLLDVLTKRIGWEIVSEYGFNCRIGRTLEKTGSSIVYVNTTSLDQAVDKMVEPLRNEFGGLRLIDKSIVYRFVLGILAQLKNKGGIFHPALESYIDKWGGYYQIGMIPYMPSFSRASRTPAFLTDKRGTRFDSLVIGGTRITWHGQWLIKCFGEYDPLINSQADGIFQLVLKHLLDGGVLQERSVQQNKVWGMAPAQLLVSRKVQQIRCKKCGHSISVASIESSKWMDMPCLRFNCNGLYDNQNAIDDYYRGFYASADIERIVAKEHTALLTRENRESLEERFIAGSNPWDPNLLSCTPTLEMGIDIGDLSTVVLCSIPPTTGNYLQRVGRSGRRDGNSFSFSIASGRPHDLYFFGAPEEMIAGAVNPPGCFLNATAVLERQLAAFSFDRWIEFTQGNASIPYALGQVLNNIDQEKKTSKFPFNFLEFLSSHQTEIYDRFKIAFQGALSPDSFSHLQIFLEGSSEGGESLKYRILNSLTQISKERESLRKRVRKLSEIIKEKEQSTIRDQNYESELDDLHLEKTALNEIITSMNKRDTYNFFTDEGLFPNYAFPEAGAVLRSIIYRKKKVVENQKRFETTIYEYERPAASAIHEYAPENSFYAEGRKVKIDQINMSLAEIQSWRFCDNCSHHEVVVEETTANCPKCGSHLWVDDGQKRRMLKMRQVVATTSEKESRSYDESDEREPKFYNRLKLVSHNEADVTVAYKLEHERIPFGFEFLKKATFREVNFGEKTHIGETMNVAGTEVPKNGFAVCKECGRVQDDPANLKHAINCRYKRSQSTTSILDYLFLYREFTSEALKILLPISSTAASTQAIHSFIAAIYLGLKKQFRGRIDHLSVMMEDEPVPGSVLRKKFLVLYDSVPGGTGYLKELVVNETSFITIFENALDILKSCSCRLDPKKDGCYRCIYSYRLSNDMKDVSREAAIRLLSDIVSNKDKMVKTESLKNISVNALFESELEARFIEALRKIKIENRTVSLKPEIMRGKPGYYLKLDTLAYYIEPQVLLNESQGVSIPVEADFVIYPELESSGIKPIAVFTDGFGYHADTEFDHLRIGRDLAQRMAICRSDKYITWSLSWEDVNAQLEKRQHPYEVIPFADHHRLFELMNQYEQLMPLGELRQIQSKTNFELFVHLLANPKQDLWKLCASLNAMAALKTVCLSKTIQEKRNDILSKEDYQSLSIETVASGGEYMAEVQEKSDRNGKIVLSMYSYAQLENLQKKPFETTVIWRLMDDGETASSPDFKMFWNNYLRGFNVFQFLPNSMFVTTQGIADGEYSTLLEKNDQFQKFASLKGKAELDSLKRITDPITHPILDILFERQCPLPEAGVELTDVNNVVIGQIELGWRLEKIGIYIPQGEEFVPRFKENGWNIYSIEEFAVSKEIVITALQQRKMK
jgi:DEAD/DEAH box helicase domain-containing protein